jgi:hypothetical protein
VGGLGSRSRFILITGAIEYLVFIGWDVTFNSREGFPMSDRYTISRPVAYQKMQNECTARRIKSEVHKAIGVLFIALAFQFLLLGAIPQSYMPQGHAQALPGLADGVIAHWSLNETSGTRVDSTGSHNLTDNGGVSYETGILGNAATFTGTKYLSRRIRASSPITNSRFPCGSNSHPSMIKRQFSVNGVPLTINLS